MTARQKILVQAIRRAVAAIRGSLDVIDRALQEWVEADT